MGIYTCSLEEIRHLTHTYCVLALLTGNEDTIKLLPQYCFTGSWLCLGKVETDWVWVSKISPGPEKSLRFHFMFQPSLTPFVLSLNKHYPTLPPPTSVFSSSCNCVLFSHYGDIKPRDRLHGQVEQSNLTRRTGCGRRSSSNSEAFNKRLRTKKKNPVKPRSEPDDISSASAAEETKTALSRQDEGAESWKCLECCELMCTLSIGWF